MEKKRATFPFIVLEYACGFGISLPLSPSSWPQMLRSTAAALRFRKASSNELYEPCTKPNLASQAKGWDWRAGVTLSLWISAIAFVANLSLLLIGVLNHNGSDNGIGILNQGSASKVAQFNSLYHTLINILSTGLLTASNFCMQLLCAPTRAEIDAAHAKQQWVDIGILSIRNLRFISRRKAILWYILAASSLPLHVLYNSAIFPVTTGQQYQISFIDPRNQTSVDTIPSGYRNLTNSQWQSLYDAQYVPDSGDLYLVTDALSFNVAFNITGQQINWNLKIPKELTLDFSSISLPLVNKTLNSTINFGSDGLTGTLGSAWAPERVVIPFATYTAAVNTTAHTSSAIPDIDWPLPIFIDLSNDTTWKRYITFGTGNWLATPPLRISHAISQPLHQSTSVQISIAFIAIVVISNFLKVVAIYFVSREVSSGFIATQGDCVASFMQTPDYTTLGYCTWDRKRFVQNDLGLHPQSDKFARKWTLRKGRFADDGRGRLFSVYFLGPGIGMTIVAIIYLSIRMNRLTDSNGNKIGTQWGSAAQTQLSFAMHSFDTRAILFNTWLANMPQIGLSISYFTINRLWTSMCFAIEWNNFAVAPKGLRTTEPKGKQRNAYFLQLPYRWAIPLVFMSALLHWLLSQAIFLVRYDVRDRGGNVISEKSRSTCGYSTLSLLVFFIAYMAFLTVTLCLFFRKIEYKVPPSDHCSLAISAACHPHPNEVDPHLMLIQWGVLRNRHGGEIQHCSLTSEECKAPVEGKLYA